MRNVLNTIENVTIAFRLLVGLAVTGVIVYYMASIAYGPSLDEETLADFEVQAEAAQQQMITAQHERDMARKGWGYGSANAGVRRERDSSGQPIGGWGKDTPR
jgi:hypothetical protein